MKQIVKGLIALGITLIVFFCVNYLILLPLNIHSGGFIFYVVCLCVLFSGIYSFEDAIVDGEQSMATIVSFIVTAVLFVLLLVFSLFGSSVFNAKKYANLIQVEEGHFAEEIPDVLDTDIMDIETAINIGSRVMGEIDNISQYTISEEYNMIVYQGRAYRVSPLEYATDIKALGNEGITGYILVDCKTQEAKLVKLDEKMKYTPSSVFSYDLTRHIRKTYKSALLGKYQFEIDEEGKPYYIVPTYRTTIGLFGGEVLDKVLVVNAVNGQIDEYDLSNVPDWVDHVDSISHIAQLTTDYYQYQKGFFNTLASQKDVKRLSYNYAGSDFKGYSSVKTNDGIKYFTGVTSANNDESILGFICMNPKNGKVTFYNCVGAEESSAMTSAEALVQNFGYTASYPFVVNVNGVETYLVALKDKTGTNKAYSLVNVKNYTMSVQSATKEDAVNQYNNLLEKAGNVNTTEQANNKDNEISAKIVNIYTVTENGTTYYYYSLEGYHELFVSSILNNRNQVKLQVGNSITVNADFKDGYYMVKTIEF